MTVPYIYAVDISGRLKNILIHVSTHLCKHSELLNSPVGAIKTAEQKGATR